MDKCSRCGKVHFQDGFSWHEYHDYLESSCWREFRNKVFRESNECVGCGDSYSPLQIHHLNYDCLGNEEDGDIQTLCWLCHTKAHTEKEDSRHAKAIDTFASKKWGDDWTDIVSLEEAEESFAEWLEWKADNP